MKRILIGTFVALLSIGAAQAQSASPEKEKQHKEHRKGAYEKLNLSADQQARMQALREDFKKQMAELKSQNLSETEAKSRRKELHKNHLEQVHNLLTAEQKAQLEKLKSERTAKSRNSDFSGGKKFRKTDSSDSTAGRGGDKTGRKGDRQRSGAALQKELNLTDAQQVQMAQIRSDFRSKLQSLRNDNALSKEEKRAKSAELAKQQREQIKTILTKEQIDKMEALRKEKASKNTR